MRFTRVWRFRITSYNVCYTKLLRVTWGINPGQAIFIDENLPIVAELPEADRETAVEAYEHMKLVPGTPIRGTRNNFV